MHVLVVDDSEPNRRLAEVLLRRHDLQVASAADGATALDLLAGEPFDLVLLDSMMPVMDGPAVAREVRRREAASGLAPIPIVALTASFLPEDRARMLEAGMDDHLAKPLRADDLAEVLDRRLPAGTIPRTVRIVGPSEKAAAWVGAGGSPILDEETFGRLADLGDPQLVGRIVKVLLADAAARVAVVDEAILGRDPERLRGALQALEAICGLVGASELSRRVRSIQDEVQRRETEGQDPLSSSPDPSGLKLLLDATRNQLEERLAGEGRSPS